MQARSPNAADFGPLLRRLRIAAELSQEELAERARMSVDAIGALERGRRKAPQRETVDLLIAALLPSEDDRVALMAAANRARLRLVDTAGEAPAEPRHNLSAQLTSLVGRDRDVAKIQTLLEAARLVTVLGTGGIGKTRVALEVAAKQLDRWPEGVWLVELAPVTDATLVAGTIALTVGGTEELNEGAGAALVRRLKHKRALLVLDNCEHLVDEVARITDSVLHDCPTVGILATSREALRVAGESVYRLPALDAANAVLLFADRARAADSEFTLTAQNTSPVAEICSRLDGLPLAIELAAARIPMLAPQQLALKLDERFAILTTGNRTAEPRQQTMQALIDWSYQMLADAERDVFRSVGVFAGGFTLEGAAAVAGVSSGDALSAILSLVDKSLVSAHPSDDETRYTLLESIRAYALAKLDETGECKATSRRHVEYVAGLVESFARLPRSKATAALAIEIENVRTALAWCAAADDALDLGAQILASATLLYTQRLYGEFLEQARYFLDRADRIDPTVQGALWLGISRRAIGAPALEAAERAIELLETAHDRSTTIVRAHVKRAQALAQQHRISEALEANMRAMKSREEFCPKDVPTLANIHHQRGFILGQMHDDAAAREEYRAAADVYDRIGDRNAAAYMRCNIADCYYREGDVEIAEQLTRESLPTFRALRNWDGEAFAYCNLAEFEIAKDDLIAAATSVAAALEASRHLASDTWLATTAFDAAALAAHSGDLHSAARLYGYVRRWREERAYVEAGDARMQSSIVALLTEGMTKDERERLESEGATLDETEVADAILHIVDGVARQSTNA